MDTHPRDDVSTYYGLVSALIARINEIHTCTFNKTGLIILIPIHLIQAVTKSLLWLKNTHFDIDHARRLNEKVLLDEMCRYN